MTRSCRPIATLCALLLLAAPACADVIPASYESGNADRSAVKTRIAELGVPSTTALAADEAAYFAANPDRIQVAGQEIWGGQANPMWWELLFGAAFLGGTIAVLWILLDD